MIIDVCNMRKFFFVINLLASFITVFAQMQQGYVKTKGRLGNDGQVIAGVRLSGATVRLIGKTVVSQASGVFSFELSNEKYAILDIQKNDY